MCDGPATEAADLRKEVRRAPTTVRLRHQHWRNVFARKAGETGRGPGAGEGLPA